MKVVCLLPVRNGEVDLPGYLDSVRRVADTIIALDDGSTDATRELLARDPLVAEILTNPVRHGFGAWDDSANRNRLLAAVDQHHPDWIISLDADERIDEGDGRALRAFIETDALPGVAYGFRWYTMTGDLDHALPEPIWVYRLFAYRRGQRFSEQRLHFPPVPTEIPRRAYVKTTFRIQHLAGLSAERRRARYEKYREADPEMRFAYDYSGLLVASPHRAMPWQPRDPNAPALFAEAEIAALEQGARREEADDAPDLSIVVIDDGKGGGARRAVESATQPSSAEVEVIVVTSRREGGPWPEGAERVQVAPAATSALRRRAGISAATGRRVLVLDGDLTLAPGAIDRIVLGHERGFASVIGPVRNLAMNPVAAYVYRRRFAQIRERLRESVIERPPPLASRARDLLVPDDRDERDAGTRLAKLGYATLRLGEPVLEFHGDSVRSLRQGMSWAFSHGLAGGRSRSPVTALERNGGRVGFVLTVAERVGGWLRRFRHVLEITRGRRRLIMAIVERRPGDVELALIDWDPDEPAIKIVRLPSNLTVDGTEGSERRLGDLFAPLDKPPGLFTAQDAVGRPLGVQIDEIVWLRDRNLDDRLDRIARQRRAAAGDLIRVLARCRDGKRGATTLERRALLVAWWRS
ncbi:MAG: glycosyltransferase, partial [Thermomicrobiales bacterium]|nr:glycosyltransferase [Thermomicrobiales bacterium]